MSLSGRLRDVPLTDVMQFIHLGRRTGILRLEQQGEQAEISFHLGAILGAWTARSKRLGELLLEAGLISSLELEAALREHETATPRRSFGQVLLSTTAVPLDQVRNALKRQIELTVLELVGWTQGSFVFEVDAVKPIDDISVYPSELIPSLDLNTQMVLLEAARVFDERNRRGSTAPTAAETAAAISLDDANSLEEGIATLGEVRHEGMKPPAVRVHAISDDPLFAAQLTSLLDTPDLDCFPHPAQRGAALERGALVVFDLRDGVDSAARLAAFLCTQPAVTVVAVVEDSSQIGAAYGAGATAVVGWDQVEALRSCLVRIAALGKPTARASDPSASTRHGLAKLRRVVSDLRSGVFSATVALNLMNIVAESVERAVLFLVRGDELVALGAFGFSRDRRPLATTTRSLALPMSGALARAIGGGQALSVPFDQASLPEPLPDLLGRPRSGQCAIFPVMGTNRVILLIYADNGDLDRPIEEIEILDLVAAEVGIAFENELLRQQLAKSR